MATAGALECRSLIAASPPPSACPPPDATDNPPSPRSAPTGTRAAPTTRYRCKTRAPQRCGPAPRRCHALTFSLLTSACSRRIASAACVNDRSLMLPKSSASPSSTDTWACRSARASRGMPSLPSSISIARCWPVQHGAGLVLAIGQLGAGEAAAERGCPFRIHGGVLRPRIIRVRAPRVGPLGPLRVPHRVGGQALMLSLLPARHLPASRQLRIRHIPRLTLVLLLGHARIIIVAPGSQASDSRQRVTA